MSRDELDPVERILANSPIAPGSRVLVLEGGSGALLQGALRSAGSIIFHNGDFNHHVQASALAPTIFHPDLRFLLSDLPRPNGALPAEESWPDQNLLPEASFDAVLYRLGKGTAAIHAALRLAFDLLKVGGNLYLCGHTREGIKSAAPKAQGHFGHIEMRVLKSSCRLLRFQKTSARPKEEIPDPGYFQPYPLVLDIPGQPAIPYLSKPGIFSYRAPDAGTSMLVANLRSHPSLTDWAGKRVLDLGCGAGPLALAAHRLGARDIVAADVQAAAVSAAQRNLAEAGAPAQVVCTHLTTGLPGDFDIILSNPPFHEGHGTDYGLPGRILDATLPKLSSGGRLLLVANQFLDYPGQARERGYGCETLAQTQSYRVLLISK